MCSVRGCRWIAAAGFPIRKSPDHRLYTASRGLSQCPTSFIGIWRQGIHRKPLVTYPRDAEKSKLFISFVTTALILYSVIKVHNFHLLKGGVGVCCCGRSPQQQTPFSPIIEKIRKFLRRLVAEGWLSRLAVSEAPLDHEPQ